MSAVAIRAAGAATPFGSLAETAAALAKSEVGFERHPEFVGIDGRELIGGYYPPCASERDMGTRLAILLQAALTEAIGAGVAPPGLVLALPVVLEQAPGLMEAFRAAAAERGLPLDGAELVFGERNASLRALDIAQARVAAGEDLVLAAVDCEVAPVMIDAHVMTDNIFDPASPYCPVPAEAAVALHLGREVGGAVLLHRPAFAAEDWHSADPARGLIGRALTEAARGALAAARGPVPALVAADLNSERHRAEEFGFCAAGLGIEAFEEPFTPAAGFGDTGVSLALLTAALTAWHIAPGQCALVLASDRGREKGALVVERG